MSLFELIAGVLSGQAAEIASLRAQLASAIADAAADDDAVAAAEAAAAEAAAKAEAAAIKVEELQLLADADTAEDQQIRDLIATYQPVPEAEVPAPEPVVEEEPTEEVEGDAVVSE